MSEPEGFVWHLLLQQTPTVRFWGEEMNETKLCLQGSWTVREEDSATHDYGGRWQMPSRQRWEGTQIFAPEWEGNETSLAISRQKLKIPLLLN